MEYYNVYQNPFLDFNKCYFGVDINVVKEMAKAFQNNKGNVKVGGRTYYIGGEVFQVYSIEKDLGDSHAIQAYFKKYITNNNRGIIDESVFMHIGKNITDKILRSVNEEITNIEKVENDKMFDLFQIMHPMILNVSKELYKHKHYKESVHAAYIELIDRIKQIYLERTGEEKDGKALMMTVFNEENPIIDIAKNELIDKKGIREGYKFIYAGVTLAIRNPKSHKNFTIEKRDAIELLLLSSRLMRKIDEVSS